MSDGIGSKRLVTGAHYGLRDWLAAGMHAEMAWMDRTAEKRIDPALVLAGARTIIMLGVNYWNQPQAAQNPIAAVASKLAPTSGQPRWARYALHADYHDTMKPGLVAAGRVLEPSTITGVSVLTLVVSRTGTVSRLPSMIPVMAIP